eukprot:350941-Chlamydomonas_euryale.AAC.18
MSGSPGLSSVSFLVGPRSPATRQQLATTPLGAAHLRWVWPEGGAGARRVQQAYAGAYAC